MATNSVRFCVSCRRPIPAARNVCPLCGAAQTTNSAQPAYPQQAAQVQQPQMQQAYSTQAYSQQAAAQMQARQAYPQQAVAQPQVRQAYPQQVGAQVQYPQAGYPQQAPYAGQAPYPQQYPYPQAYVYPQPKKSHGGAIAALIIIGILVIGGVMLFNYLNSKSPSNQYKKYKNKAENYFEDMMDW